MLRVQNTTEKRKPGLRSWARFADGFKNRRVFCKLRPIPAVSELITAIWLPPHPQEGEWNSAAFILGRTAAEDFDFLLASKCPAVPQAKELIADLFYNFNVGSARNAKISNFRPPIHPMLYYCMYLTSNWLVLTKWTKKILLFSID